MRTWIGAGLVLALWAAVGAAPVRAQDEFGGSEFGGSEFGQPKAPAQTQPAPQTPPSEQKAPEAQPAEQQPPAAGTPDEFGAAPATAAGEGQAQPAPTTAEQTAPPPAAETEAAGATNEEPAPSDAEAERARKLRRHNTVKGSVGGVHVVDAGSGPAGSFRVQFAGDFFVVKDFIRQGDKDNHIGGHLSLSWSIIDNLEAYASIAAYANSNTLGDPQLLQVLGDTLFGLKGFAEVLPWLTIGGDASFALLNTVGDIGVVFQSTSFGFRGNVTADLQGLENPLPLVFRLNLQYWFDNSEKLIEDVENARYIRVPMRRPRDDEWRHLVLPEERFGLQINRTDFFNIGLGIEAPIGITENFYINPILEWTWSIPVNRQGFDCLIPPSEELAAAPTFGQDGCLDVVGPKAFPQDLTLAVRVLPGVKGLALLAGADIGLTGAKPGQFVRELAPNAPYDIWLAVSYAYDTRPKVKTVVKEEKVETPVPVAKPPLRGRIHGTVVEQGTGAPVAGAVVGFPSESGLNAIVAGDDGTFTTYPFDPGTVEMHITHPDYEPGTCMGTVPDERPAEGEELVVEVKCELISKPKQGDVQGKVLGVDGEGVSGAQLQIAGPVKKDLTTADGGAFTLKDVPPGQYTALVQADKYLVKLEQFEVKAGQSNQVEITLIPRPRRSMVRVRKRQIVIRRQINFATDSAEILPSSEPILNEVVDVLLRNPQLKLIEIQGHTDNRGPSDHNMELSLARAESVKDWLVRHGIEANRLEAKGFGETRPLVPNITAANRARNRRVQFMIMERAEDGGGED